MIRQSTIDKLHPTPKRYALLFRKGCTIASEYSFMLKMYIFCEYLTRKCMNIMEINVDLL